WSILLNESYVKFEIYDGTSSTFLYFQIPSIGDNGAFCVWEIKIMGTAAIPEINLYFFTILFLGATATLFLIIAKEYGKIFNRKKVRRKLILITFVMLLTPFKVTYALDHVNDFLMVGENGFKTISEAVKVASNGDTVFVKAGVYKEQLIIDKMLTIHGENWEETIIETNGSIDAVIILANNVNIRGFTIRNYGRPTYSNGIRLINASNCVIEGNLIEGKFIGIKLENGSRGNIVRNNVIKNNQYGIFLIRAIENIIFNNLITNNCWNGIELAWSNYNVFEANDIVNNGGFGIEIPIYTPSFGNIIFHNNFINNSLQNFITKHASDFFNNNWFFNDEGNFWDDCAFYDNNRDAVGDVMYPVNQELGIYDKCPLMGKFRYFTVFNETISIISNSQIQSLNVTVLDNKICFYLSINNYQGSSCSFARIRIPSKILTKMDYLLLSGSSYIKIWQSANYFYVYTEYYDTNAFIQIRGTTLIPEFNTELFLLLLIMSLLTSLNKNVVNIWK
ncbi:MAG: NosD domain-containing protein, partial [Candidatus Methanomethylicia archaeon]